MRAFMSDGRGRQATANAGVDLGAMVRWAESEARAIVADVEPRGLCYLTVGGKRAANAFQDQVDAFAEALSAFVAEPGQ